MLGTIRTRFSPTCHRRNDALVAPGVAHAGGLVDRSAVPGFCKELAVRSRNENLVVPDYHVWDRTEAFPYGDV